MRHVAFALGWVFAGVYLTRKEGWRMASLYVVVVATVDWLVWW